MKDVMRPCLSAATASLKRSEIAFDDLGDLAHVDAEVVPSFLS
jgi:hypothetical protein